MLETGNMAIGVTNSCLAARCMVRNWGWSLVTVAIAAPSCAAQSARSSAISSGVVCLAMQLLAPRMRVQKL